MSCTAKFVEEIVVKDPDSGGLVEMEVYKHENGGMFAIDSSFLDQVAENPELMETVILDPFSHGDPQSLYEEKISGKWEKLNKEFDDVINNLTDEQWKEWYDSLPKRDIEQEKSNKGSSYCGNPITTEDTCNVLAKKKTCNGCKYQTKVKQLEEGPNETN